MMSLIALIAIFVVKSATCLDEPTMDEEHARDIAIFRGMYQVAEECVKEANVDVGPCLEMFRNTNLSDPAYTQCKCLIPCVGRKMNFLKDDGTYNFDKIREFTKHLQSDYLMDEVKRVLDICETEPGTECEGGFNLVYCAVQHSHAAARAVRMMVEELDEKLNYSAKTAKPEKAASDDGK